MATLEEIRAARARDKVSGDPLAQIRAARAKDRPTTPDGRITAPGTTEEMASKIPPGMIYDEASGQYKDTALMAESMGKGQGAVASFMAGIPFVGEFVDEAMGKADQAVTGRPAAIGQEIVRQSRDQFREANPKTAIGLEIAGGITGSLPLASAGVGLAAKAPGIMGRSIAGAAMGGAAGGLEGAAAGYGRGRTDDERAKEAVKGGAIGAGLGGALGFIAPSFGMGVKAVYRRVRGLDVSTIADALDVDKRTARVIKSHLVNDDLDAAEALLRQAGPDSMLADAGMGTAQALDTAAQTGGKALRTASDAVGERANKAGVKLNTKLDDILGTAQGVKTSAKGIAQRTAKVRQAAYDRAYAAPINYADDAGRKIEDALSRIPPKTLNAAVDEANEAMTAAGLRNQQIMASIADDGSVVFREMPNVRQLDEIKKALDSVGRAEVDQFGRPTSKGIRAGKLAADLRNAAQEAVPEYKTAVKLGGDKIAEDKALDIGRRLLAKNTTREEVVGVMRGASREAKTAARQGLRDGISEILDNVKRTITDPNVDAREAMQLVKDASSKANKTKLRLVLGQRDADRLLAELDEATFALTLRGAIAQNSKTAIRQSGQEAMREATEPGAFYSLMRAEPAKAAQKVVQSLTGATDAAAVEMRADVAAQIAEALTGIRGPEAQRALAIVRRAINGQPLKDSQAKIVARVVADPLLLGGYQIGQQVLE